MRIILVFTLFFLGGCIWEGTGTGNPHNPSAIEDRASVAQIVEDICFLVKNCHDGVTLENCHSGVSRLTGFAPRLGVLVEPPPTVIELMLSELEGKIVSDVKSTDSCRTEITKLQCDDDRVLKAYLPAEIEPFAGTAELLSPVCVGVFGDKASP